MRKYGVLGLGIVLALGAGTLAGCGNAAAAQTSQAAGTSAEQAVQTADTAADAEQQSETAENTEVRTIKIAHTENGVPYGYVDDDGKSTGYDVEVLRLADELIPEYAFEFIGTGSSTDAWVGAQEGKYQIAITNSFYTQERAKNYIIPEHWLGACLGGIIVRKENADVDSFEKASEQGFKHVPIKAGDGWQFVLEDYNAKHPDKQVEFELTDNEDWSVGIPYVAEGRYDLFGTIKTLWTRAVEAEDGAYHDLYDDLVFNEFLGIKTYTLINKNEADLAEKINDALIELEKEGKLSEVSIQFYGEDLTQYIED
ncbi:amino acid ABC transporter substrate-binding protein (PAAT family) [Kineothrix alysoides]|uniref:Amino acid ABC transporter substrate-binding protein (PAAT family) n=1 Tax=Kineothrix alysoides TaxID=1469948 RepID=A0A4R1R3J5_9FIRM|nr:transporter substrate-binding domain-containing protein [Kineothrix alysoides]TCL60016.1 amino acid ABC transporter substrate-binding protein (PAAT family) [Kineothrix alysoides]